MRRRPQKSSADKLNTELLRRIVALERINAHLAEEVYGLKTVLRIQDENKALAADTPVSDSEPYER